MKKKAFTLVELLVVISIIALLVSILMPALGRARDQAKLTLCGVNMRQIGTLVAVYQTDYNDKVPILLNRHTTGYNAWAKYSFLSIAMRDYVEYRSEFGTGATKGLSLNGFWNPEAGDTYTLACVPDFFVCPFVRGKKSSSAFVDVADVTLTGNGVSKTYDLWEKRGYTESYDTWLWLNAGSGAFGNHPYGTGHGKAKYKTLNWYNTQWMMDKGYPPAGKWMEYLKNISFSDNYARIADKTSLYCSQGEWLVGDDRLFNYQSHARGGFGGSNALFGDTHIEWVQGSQIGWP